MTKSKLFLGAALLAMPLATTPASAVTFVLNNLGGVEQGTDAFNGFTAAARFWETVLTNNSTVSLNVGFSQLAPNVLGSTGSTTSITSAETVVNSIRASGTTNLDAQLVMPTLTASTSRFANPGQLGIASIISGANPDGNGVAVPLTRTLQLADTVGTFFSANTSLLKATGAIADSNAVDGSVSFSTDFTFDFDPTDGITVGSFDFIGIAIHEIGHALGFRSGVDSYDRNANIARNLTTDFALMSSWDLFRYSQESAAAGINDWAVGGHTDPNTASYFSIDGGLTNFTGDAFLSTGRNLGDGQQASHWRDVGGGQVQRGIMDPTISRGTESIITGLDLAAFDAMGWNLNYDVLADPGRQFTSSYAFGLVNGAVPEPATWAFMIFGFGMIGGAMRRRKTKVAVSYA